MTPTPTPSQNNDNLPNSCKPSYHSLKYPVYVPNSQMSQESINSQSSQESINSQSYQESSQQILITPKEIPHLTQSPEDDDESMAIKQKEAIEKSYLNLKLNRNQLKTIYLEKTNKYKKKIYTKNIKINSLEYQLDKQQKLMQKLIEENMKLKSKNKKLKKRTPKKNKPTYYKFPSCSFSEKIILSPDDALLGELAEDESLEDDTYEKAKKYMKKNNGSLDGFVPVKKQIN